METKFVDGFLQKIVRARSRQIRIMELLTGYGRILYTILLFSFAPPAIAQAENELKIPSNSFEDFYRKVEPSLKYIYDSTAQTHNYSDNWDFDGDGIKDELYFVGTQGVHSYYYLKIVLSSDHKARALDFVLSDYPVLTANDTSHFNELPVGFVVAKWGSNTTPTMIVRLDEQTFSGNKEFIKRNIRSKNVMIHFKKGRIKYSQFPNF